MRNTPEDRVGFFVLGPSMGFGICASLNRFAFGVAFFQGEFEVQVGPFIFGIYWGLDQ